MAQKHCSRCEKPFNCCNETSGCWCENYQLSKETLQELRKRFDNCLCENCLAEFALKAAEAK